MATHQLITVEEQPYNAETPLAALDRSITPGNLFFVRSHFDIPLLDLATWRLQVTGLVEDSLQLSLSDLQAMPARTVALTLECAGNGRAMVQPTPEGTPWGYGAASSAEFHGAPLVSVLERAGLAAETVEIRCVGADRGEITPGRREAFARGLPMSAARDPGTLLAWAMNGEPLTAEHGFPVRLVVPGWYGMASVKWLSEITASGTAFDGYFQRERYVYTTGATRPGRAPVTRMRVRSVIAVPADGAEVKAGPIDIRGTAWSGAGPVVRVEVTLDEGHTWQPAELRRTAAPHLPLTWRFRWRPDAAGVYRLAARATDAAANMQPFAPVWNQYGYGNNAVQWVRVTVR